MRICYVSNAILGSQNASAVHVIKMCNAFCEIFFDVIVVSASQEGGDALKARYGKIDFKLVGSSAAKFYILYRFFLSIFFGLKSNVLYSRWVTFFAFYPIFFWQMRILELHVVPSTLIFRIGMTLDRLLYKKTIFVFITHGLKNDFIERYSWVEESRCFVLPDGADPIVKEIHPSQFFKRNHCCGYIGSFNKGKGLETIVELAGRMPDFQFIVAGGTEKEVAVMKLHCSSNVSFLGYVPPSLMAEVFDSFSIALLPNRSEVYVGGKNIGEWTSPMKMFEYMAAGKAIVASNLPVLREVLNGLTNSVLVEPDDLQDWEDAIRRVSEDKELAWTIASGALRDLVNNYSWRARAENIRKIILDATSR